MGAPVVITVGGTAVAGAVLGRTVVVEVVVGSVDVVVVAHFYFFLSSSFSSA